MPFIRPVLTLLTVDGIRSLLSQQTLANHHGIAPNKSTCNSKYGNTFIRKEVIRTGNSPGISSDKLPIKTLNSNIVDEDIFEPMVKNKRPEDQTTDEWLADWEAAFTPEEFNEVMTDFSKIKITY
jgi:hypothetical protein